MALVTCDYVFGHFERFIRTEILNCSFQAGRIRYLGACTRGFTLFTVTEMRQRQRQEAPRELRTETSAIHFIC